MKNVLFKLVLFLVIAVNANASQTVQDPNAVIDSACNTYVDKQPFDSKRCFETGRSLLKEGKPVAEIIRSTCFGSNGTRSLGLRDSKYIQQCLRNAVNAANDTKLNDVKEFCEDVFGDFDWRSDAGFSPLDDYHPDGSFMIGVYRSTFRCYDIALKRLR